MPNLDDLIKETLHSRAERMHMPLSRWSELSNQLSFTRKWPIPFKASTTVAACLIVAFVAVSGTVFFRHGSSSAPAQIPVQLSGTIQSITPGNPSHATLIGVSDIETPNTPAKHLDSKMITLPAGNWVAPGHWQSVGDTMDLFVGEEIMDVEHEKQITGHVDTDFQQAIIKVVSKGELIVNKVLMESSGAETSSQLATIHLKPYTNVSSADGSAHVVSDLKPGQRVNIVMEGTRSYLIASQITVLLSK